MTLKKLKKKGVVVLLGLTLCTNSASAAIPVIDDQNILQQLKTYTETLNVVRNTAEQITLQMKELAALPQSILDSYKQAFDESVGNIKEVLASADFFSDPAEWDEYWRETYPRISGGTYEETVWSERSINDTLREIMSMRNQEDVKNYHDLMLELQLSKERLQELLEQNKSAVGNKQVTQIANQIAAEKANIESISTAIQAITDKNKVMQQQTEVLKQQNRKTVIEAGRASERETISRMHDEVDAKGPMLDNPFENYGTLRLDW